MGEVAAMVGAETGVTVITRHGVQQNGDYFFHGYDGGGRARLEFHGRGRLTLHEKRAPLSTRSDRHPAARRHTTMTIASYFFEVPGMI